MALEWQRQSNRQPSSPSPKCKHRSARPVRQTSAAATWPCQDRPATKRWCRLAGSARPAVFCGIRRTADRRSPSLCPSPRKWTVQCSWPTARKCRATPPCAWIGLPLRPWPRWSWQSRLPRCPPGCRWRGDTGRGHPLSPSRGLLSKIIALSIRWRKEDWQRTREGLPTFLME